MSIIDMRSKGCLKTTDSYVNDYRDQNRTGPDSLSVQTQTVVRATPFRARDRTSH